MSFSALPLFLKKKNKTKHGEHLSSRKVKPYTLFMMEYLEHKTKGRLIKTWVCFASKNVLYLFTLPFSSVSLIVIFLIQLEEDKGVKCQVTLFMINARFQTNIFVMLSILLVIADQNFN